MVAFARTVVDVNWLSFSEASDLDRHLSGLVSGDVARVAGVEAAQTAAKRLADMGFVRGAVVEMVRPGKPCLVRIGGTYVGLGLENQNSVLVEPV